MKNIFFALLIVCTPFTAEAARISLEATPKNVGVGDVVDVLITVLSEESVNAFSGSLQYPASLEPIVVSDGDSIASLWMARPTIGKSAIAFAGLVPNGFTGSGKLFDVQFKAVAAGDAVLSLTLPDVRQNDGKGTRAATVAEPLRLTIAPHALGSFRAPADTEPPESFVPLITKDPVSDSWELIFSTVDKKSGIDHYEIAESRLPFLRSFASSTSPYVLHDSYRTSDVIVRAIDNAGNVREIVFHRQALLRPYELWALGGMLCVLLLYVWRKRFAHS